MTGSSDQHIIITPEPTPPHPPPIPFIITGTKPIYVRRFHIQPFEVSGLNVEHSKHKTFL